MARAHRCACRAGRGTSPPPPTGTSGCSPTTPWMPRSARNGPSPPSPAPRTGRASARWWGPGAAEACAALSTRRCPTTGAGERPSRSCWTTSPAPRWSVASPGPGTARTGWPGSPGRRTTPKVVIPRRTMVGICAGFRPGAATLLPDGTPKGGGHNVVPVPALTDPADLIGWHPLAAMPEVAMRRARRMDVWRDGDAYRVDAHFRDSCSDPELTEVAVHEYSIEATIDAGTLVLTHVRGDAQGAPLRRMPRGRAQRRSAGRPPPGGAAARRAGHAQGHRLLHAPQRRAPGARRCRQSPGRRRRCPRRLSAGCGSTGSVRRRSRWWQPGRAASTLHH